MPRYIDAEKVEKWLHRDDWGTPDARWRPEEEFGKMIDSMPTEDVAPIVHGEWIFEGVYDEFPYRCSECGMLAQTNEYEFCHCGAKMDGKENGNECNEQSNNHA